ncbi:sensor histidine kinase [Streptomyces sp. NRRL B-1347]|uniref:sensor histidine kinase n=1 Tax=Streptomyces sp. NRRL B-1347 TaxID=1476877 RepID=UPI001F3DA0E0|nr:histidine kinase [Streptomyces sp. NRRL B-1347]
MNRRRMLLLALPPALLLWLGDLVSNEPDGSWLPLVSGPLALAALFACRRVAVETLTAGAALASGALTLGMLGFATAGGSWGVLESAALLALLAVAARTARVPAAYVLCPLLAVAIVTAPVRMGFPSDAETYAFLLTVAAGGALALGCYLRSLDRRRADAVTAVQEAERLALARDLHDFVAHHVTGIVVQAQAARTIRETAPEQLDPLLAGIERAGTETLASMRRLVHVLRAAPDAPTRPADLLTELAALVAAHGDSGGAAATLDVSADARALALAPEVETSAHRVVQESLTNVRRHAPEADGVRVRLTAHGGRLRVEVGNGPAPAGDRPPPGGSGGLGLVGLRERVEAVGGRFDAGPAPDGGWRVRAEFPPAHLPH